MRRVVIVVVAALALAVLVADLADAATNCQTVYADPALALWRCAEGYVVWVAPRTTAVVLTVPPTRTATSLPTSTATASPTPTSTPTAIPTAVVPSRYQVTNPNSRPLDVVARFAVPSMTPVYEFWSQVPANGSATYDLADMPLVPTHWIGGQVTLSADATFSAVVLP